MKKALVSIVCLACIGTGVYFFLGTKGGQTEKTVSQAVDSLNSVLTQRADNVDAAVKNLTAPHFTQLDSLTDVLDSIQWTPVKDGGDYEAESKKIFETKKKDVARSLKKAYQDNNIVTPKKDRLQEIIDQE